MTTSAKSIVTKRPAEPIAPTNGTEAKAFQTVFTPEHCLRILALAIREPESIPGTAFVPHLFESAPDRIIATVIREAFDRHGTVPSADLIPGFVEDYLQQSDAKDAVKESTRDRLAKVLAVPEHDFPHVRGKVIAWAKRQAFTQMLLQGADLIERGEEIDDDEIEEGVARIRAIGDGTGNGPVIVPAADVTPRRVEALWPKRILRGKLNLLVGNAGRGKSFVATDVAARLSTGDDWPAGTGRAPTGRVLMLTGEDDIADTVVPRLKALGADLTKIDFLQAIKKAGQERVLSLEHDLPHLERAIDETRPDLIIIDVLNDFFAVGAQSKDTRRRSYTDTDVRAVLTPLIKLIERYGVAVLAIMHLNKNQQLDVLHRVLGSVGFVAKARSVLIVGRDPRHPDDPNGGDVVYGILAGGKQNLSSPPTMLGYRIQAGGDGIARVIWEPEPVRGVRLEELVTAPKEKSAPASQDAENLLRQVFHERTEVPAKEVETAAKELGISHGTMMAIRRRLGIQAEKRGGFGKDESGKSIGHWALVWADGPGSGEHIAGPGSQPKNPAPPSRARIVRKKTDSSAE